MRTVKVFSTNTDQLVEIQTSASTWGELQRDLASAGIDYNGMKAVVRETQSSLEGTQAPLPTGEFRLFLSPSKIKSGGNN